MKLNVSIIIVLISILTFSCSVNKTLEYHVSNGNAVKPLREKIELLKKLNREIIFVFDREDSLNTITLIPITDKHIQNFSVANSNRYMIIGGHKYTVVFGFDYDLGVRREELYEEGVLNIKMHKKVNINEYAIKLCFDKKWNFLY